VGGPGTLDRDGYAGWFGTGEMGMGWEDLPSWDDNKAGIANEPDAVVCLVWGILRRDEEMKHQKRLIEDQISIHVISALSLQFPPHVLN
jgi:hypothetical protein